MEVDFVCVTLSRYMKIGQNFLNEVPVEKSILADFDQLITLVNEWKAKWVHEGYSRLKKKTPKRPKRSSKSQEDTKVSGHQCRQSVVDLHGSKPLISLVPFNLHFHCFQG